MYEVKFWNIANECVRIAGKYIFYFDTFEDAFNGGNALATAAAQLGAVGSTINGEYYELEED